MPGRRWASVGSTGAGDTEAASVAGSEARGGVREDVRFPGGRTQSGRERRTGRTGRLRVGERMISNESPVREIRTLGSMSGERKRGRSGVRGTAGMTLGAGIRAPSTARPARLSSTLRPVKNVKDFQFSSPRAEAVGILDQSRSDPFVGADWTACAGWEHQDPDGARVRPRRTMRLTNANRDPS